MDGLIYYPFHFVGKKNNPEHARKNCKVLRVVHREGEFTVPTVFALEGSIENIVLRWNEYSFCSYMGPNQERIMDQMASRLSVSPQVSFIKTGTYEGINWPCSDYLDFVFMFLLWLDGLPLVTFLFISSKLHF